MWKLYQLTVFLGSVQYVFAQQPNSVTNFCMRWYHQSIVKNGSLYIAGGNEVFAPQIGMPYVSNLTQGINEYMIKVDMSASWDWYVNITETVTKMTLDPIAKQVAPSRIMGSMYQGAPNDTRLWMYGGTTSYWNTSFPGWTAPTEPDHALWSYDTANGRWTAEDVTSGNPIPPSAGASVEAPYQGLAFYLNGEVDSGSTQTTNVNETKIVQKGMIVVDTRNGTTVNISTSTVTGDFPRTRGGLEYVPSIGFNGVLVAFGGSYKKFDKINNNEVEHLVSMTEIDIFDIDSYYRNASNPVWYKQNTTGVSPAPRIEFCSVMVSAPDNSSHNIHVYGGRGSGNDTYDDVWVLSLPSFTWTQIYGPGASPRFGHTCHLVGNRQMLTVGGITSLTSPLAGPCDWEFKSVAVYNLNELYWGSTYISDTTPYIVPYNLAKTIGGANGTAIISIPIHGFDDPALEALFGVNTPHKGLKAGPIAGIVIGSLASVVILGVLGWLIFRILRRKKVGPLPSGSQEMLEFIDPFTRAPKLSSPDKIEKTVSEVDGREGSAREVGCL